MRDSEAHIPTSERFATRGPQRESGTPFSRLPADPAATILLVDDEPMLRDIGVAILSDLGFQLLVASNGVDALRQIHEHEELHIVLLFTDVVMPEMDGATLAAEFERLLPGSKVLFCSGYPRDMLAQHGPLGPQESFLQKPYTVDALRKKVCTLLEVPHR